MILLEEAWKAISKEGMAEYLKYLFKTVRKFFGEAVVVTQEVEDIISSSIVKGTIINNSDCKILLDQRKYVNKFDEIQGLLGLTDKERAQILSINLSNAPGRKYKEVWIGLGGAQSQSMPRRYPLKSTTATPPRRPRSWSCSGLPRNWAEISNSPSSSLPRASEASNPFYSPFNS